jgi:two-component system, OmpR family, phosphate regulon response regulator OmpR
VAQQPHIVVVDDEAHLRETLEEFLTLRGFDVTSADGGAALRRIIADRPADLVLLDINMPGEDGLTLARFLRQETSAAIVMLTSASDVVDRVVGLELGADDYIAKPFDLREVVARIKSVLRRGGPLPGDQPAAAPAAPPPASTAKASDDIRFGRFVLNLPSRRLFAEDGSQVPLTSMEFDLLKALGTHPNKALNRDQILDLAHGREWDPFDRSIDIRITRIRRKIEEDPARPRIIRTVRGVGYMFVPVGD